MVYDLLDLKIDFRKAIIDNYNLKDGLYVKIDKEVEFFRFKNNKKENDKSLCLFDLGGNPKPQEFSWFARRDYLSNYLESNKAIDPPKKKIHNNNYLTLFAKVKEFNDENKEHFIQKLYENLKTFESFKDKEKKVIKSYENYILNPDRINDIKEKKHKFLDVFEEVKQKIKDLGLKDNEYVRIYFDEDLEKYEQESKLYYLMKIYNKIETTREIEDKIYGLSNFNMGLNQKKPFLEHKTRGFSLPFMVNEEIFEIKELFDYLKTQRDIPIISPTKEKPGLFLKKHSSNDQAEITDFDILVLSNELKKPFILKNYLEITKEKEILRDRKAFSNEELFMLIDEVFYNGQLKNNLFDDVYSKLPNRFQNLIYLTRDIAKNILKGVVNLKTLNKFAFDFVDYYVRNGNFFKAKEVVNFYLSVKEYEGESMGIKQKLNELEKKVENLEELNDEEFFILSGQVIMYLLNKSKKSDKKADMIEPFLRAGKSKKLKQEIETLYFKYKHEIPLNFKKLNNAIALIMAYDEDIRTSEYKDKLLLGLLSENIFFRKDDK